MSDAEFAMWFELGAAVVTTIVVTGIICTAWGIWRDEKTWKGDEE